LKVGEEIFVDNWDEKILLNVCEFDGVKLFRKRK